MNKHRITVVTVCYNAVDSIEKTILSVLNQSYQNIEYIVIDGGSIDGTIDIIKKYQDKISCFISEPDEGIYDAMNKGLKIATGEWICFMNAGDFFFNGEVLEKMNFELYSADSIACLYGNYKSLNKLRTVDVICNKPFYRKKKLVFSPGMGFHHQSSFVRTKIAKTLLFDNYGYKLCADYNMIYQIYKMGYLFEYVNIFVAVVDNSTGASANNRILQLQEHYKVLGMNNNVIAQYRIMKLRIKEHMKKIFHYDKFIHVVKTCCRN